MQLGPGTPAGLRGRASQAHASPPQLLLTEGSAAAAGEAVGHRWRAILAREQANSRGETTPMISTAISALDAKTARGALISDELGTSPATSRRPRHSKEACGSGKGGEVAAGHPPHSGEQALQMAIDRLRVICVCELGVHVHVHVHAHVAREPYVVPNSIPIYLSGAAEANGSRVSEATLTFTLTPTIP